MKIIPKKNSLVDEVKYYFDNTNEEFDSKEKNIIILIAKQIEKYNNDPLRMQSDSSFISLSMEQKVRHIFNNNAPKELSNVNNKSKVLATILYFDPIENYFKNEKRLTLESTIYAIADRLRLDKDLHPVVFNKLSNAKKELEELCKFYKNDKQYIIMGKVGLHESEK